MTSFRFRLQKVLDWRRVQLELEEVKFKQAAAGVPELDRALVELRAAMGEQETQLRGAQLTTGLDWAALGFYRMDVKKDEREIANKRVEAAKKLAVQQAAMLEARQRCRLLERLKERRLSEWEAASDRELDETAAESYLAQWSRRETEKVEASV